MIVFFLCFALPLSAIAPFYKGALEGFYHYQEFDEEEEEEQQTPEAVFEILQAFKQEAIARLHKAVVFPTKKNVIQFLEIQNTAIQNSEKFGEVWAQVILENAHLSGQLTNPTDSFAIKHRKWVEQEQIDALIREKGKSHVLLFFFDSKDHYSQAAAEMVKLFEEKCLWKVMGISLDGEALPEFPNPRYTKDQGKNLNIQAAPAYVVLNPQTEQAIHVGYGAISLSRLKENIFSQLKETK